MTIPMDRSEATASNPDHATASARAVTALIVTYQSAAHIGGLLHVLRREATGLDLEVLVVDNASHDDTERIVRRFDDVTFVSSGGNLGYAAAINVGSRLVDTQRALIILNPDLELFPGALVALLDGVRPGVGVVVPRLENADGSLCPSQRHEPTIGRAMIDGILGRHAAWLPDGWSAMTWRAGAYTRRRSVDWATGAALLVTPECRARVGDWDDRFFLYSEETDFLRRVRGVGLSVVYEPAACVRHVGGGSGTSVELAALCGVNTVRYFRKHHGPMASVAFAGVTALTHLARLRRPSSRLALRALLSCRVRARLPGPSAGAGGSR